MKLRLYHYWRSTSSWRVRWALAHKGLPCEYEHVSLLDGESESTAHLQRNPMGFVPVLETIENGHSQYLSESVAIVEWLEEQFPDLPLILPVDSEKRAKVRQLSEIINAGTQPLQNLSTLDFLGDAFGADTEQKKKWSQYWIRKGLKAFESVASHTHGRFSVGDEISMADFCMVAQCYNAERNEIPLSEFPLLQKIREAAMETQGYMASEPNQFKPLDFKT